MLKQFQIMKSFRYMVQKKEVSSNNTTTETNVKKVIE